ncbi:MAG TPA: quinoprotein dehydrogenase-associated putative ABC transporter substrate-binding protein [Hyphomicrobium sp.]|nr:quinoprotein dehydrogenase-associated putative ABC transporter substrate-binding protein [Hyphomicrobium sp.]HRO51386.1 quinoprotein dehydrogenase-associated putative ABC transporter substrate-binding protein [Hyphomicrobium sp.]
MSLACRSWLLILAAVPLAGASAADARELRVCADPDNMPFSHQSGEGFENKVMALVGREIGVEVTFVWAPQWRGFVRKTLRAKACDVIPGIPAGIDRARTTRPYYTSSYVFVTRRGRAPIRSFADLSKGMAIGVQLIGDDGVNSPPVEELAARGYTSELKGYMAWGRVPDKGAPHEQIMMAVADGTVDVAVVWGPPAGYFATREAVPLDVHPVDANEKTVVPMTFEIGMGVRRDDEDLAKELDAALVKLAPEIRSLLDSYGLPQPARKSRAELAP